MGVTIPSQSCLKSQYVGMYLITLDHEFHKLHHYTSRIELLSWKEIT